jgi:hypothetical protein
MARIGVIQGSRMRIFDAHVIVGLEPVARQGATKPFGISHVSNAAREWFASRFSSCRKVAGLIVTEGTHIGHRGMVVRERSVVVALTSAVFAGDKVVDDKRGVEEMLNDLAAYLATACQQIRVQVVISNFGCVETWHVGVVPDETDIPAV